MSPSGSVPPDVEAQLARIRKTVESLRAVAAKHARPEILERSHPAVQEVTAGLDQATAELEPLGFLVLGDTGAPLSDGTIVVSRVFRHTDGSICGWVGFAKTKGGPKLLVFLVSESPKGAYYTSLRNASPLSLARAPHLSRDDYGAEVPMAEIVARHRARTGVPAGDGRLTSVATLGEAIDLMERFHEARMLWRVSCNEDELLRADLTSVLAHYHRTMEAPGFRLLYGHAAKWLGFRPEHPAYGGFVESAPSPLTLWLASPPGEADGDRRSAYSESDWLSHCDFPVQGRRLQLLDVVMAGNDGEGVIIDVPPGVYAVEARVMTHETDHRISRVRVHPKGTVGTVGSLAGRVGVDLGAVAICDVDRLAPWARDHEDAWQVWGQDLWYGRTEPAGLYTCTAASTVVPFLDSGRGDGTYPVYSLMENGRAIGLEAVFLAADQLVSKAATL